MFKGELINHLHVCAVELRPHEFAVHLGKFTFKIQKLIELMRH